MQTLGKHKSFSIKQIKRRAFPFPKHSKTRQLAISHKFPFSFQSTQSLQKQTFPKEIFFLYFVNKTLKTNEND